MHILLPTYLLTLSVPGGFPAAIFTGIGWFVNLYPFFGQKSPAAKVRELFKPSTDSASLLIEIEKSVFCFGIFWR